MSGGVCDRVSANESCGEPESVSVVTETFSSGVEGCVATSGVVGASCEGGRACEGAGILP